MRTVRSGAEMRRSTAPCEIVADRMIEVIGEIGECGVRDRSQRHLLAERGSATGSRRARVGDFTVPIGHESTSAVSLSLKPREVAQRDDLAVAVGKTRHDVEQLLTLVVLRGDLVRRGADRLWLIADLECELVRDATTNAGGCAPRSRRS